MEIPGFVSSCTTEELKKSAEGISVGRTADNQFIAISVGKNDIRPLGDNRVVVLLPVMAAMLVTIGLVTEIEKTKEGSEQNAPGSKVENH